MKRPIFLRNLSLRTRVLFCLGCVFIVSGLLFVALSLTHMWVYTIIIAIPVACIAYLFKPRTLYSSVTLLFVIVIWMTIVTGCNVFGSWSDGGLFAGVIVFFYVEAYSIRLLRATRDAIDNVRHQSERVEQRLMHAYEHERQLNTLKDQFLLNISHELRTPLTEVKGYVNLLLQLGETTEPDMRMAFLQNAAYGCDELELLIANVMDASRVESDVKPPVLQDVAIHETIIDLLKHINMQEHLLQLNVPVDIVVRADRQQFCQILRNLLSNACKYSPTQTTVSVEAVVEYSGPDAQPFARIGVSDMGPGITAQDIPTLFQKFTRLKRDQSDPVRGTGLGLYISKKFVEGMRGRIWVESMGITGHGSQFYFTLPLAQQNKNGETDSTALYPNRSRTSKISLSADGE